MSETQAISTEDPAPVPVKEAEVKLKEMSRKAKERNDSTRHRGTTQARKPPQRQDGNLRLVLIGGFGIGVLGILYLMLRPGKKEEVPTPKENLQKPVDKTPVKEKPAPEMGFEINSF